MTSVGLFLVHRRASAFSVYGKKRRKNMLSKIWKKVCILILIVACLFNIVLKLVNRISFNKEALTSAQYMLKQYEYEKDKENVIK